MVSALLALKTSSKGFELQLWPEYARIVNQPSKFTVILCCKEAGHNYTTSN